MKSLVVLFERNTYQSNTDGTARTWISRDELRKVLGQAKSMRVQIIGYRNAANTGVRLKMYENSYLDLRPSETNASGSPFWTGTEATTLRPAPENISGPFGANVEFTLEVRNTSAASQVEFDGIVVVTLILEE